MSEPVFDVCVAGSGPGGGIASYVLANAGLKVVLVEAGKALRAGIDYNPHLLRTLSTYPSSRRPQMPKSTLPRRSFLKSAGAIGAMATGSLSGVNAAVAGGFGASQNPANNTFDTKYPKLSMIVPYSPQNLRFAASVGYEGIVIPINGNTSDLDNLTDSQIDKIAATARDVGIKIISLDCMFGFNHIAKDAGERKLARSRFLRSLELAHRLGLQVRRNV